MRTAARISFNKSFLGRSGEVLPSDWLHALDWSVCGLSGVAVASPLLRGLQSTITGWLFREDFEVR